MDFQHSAIAVPLTNLPLSTGTALREDGTEELVWGTIRAVGERLTIVPSVDRQVQDLVRSGNPEALDTISATLVLATDLGSVLAPPGATAPDIATVVCCVCDLLSFATRRGISFVPGENWWSGQGPVVRGRCRLDGPVEPTGEIELLLSNGLPKMFDPVFRDTRRIVLALRWFLGWHEESSVEMKFVRLWIPLEMLAKKHWTYLRRDPPPHKPPKPGKTHRIVTMDYVWGFIEDLDIPGASQVPLDDMYWARNVIVHGDPDAAEQKMCERFGHLARERRKRLAATRFPGFSAEGTARLPDPSSYGMCLHEAAEMLSRLLEKVFLRLFDCTATYFYGTAPYLTTIGP